jgi:RNA polymerase sigma-70 factor (ECF subfamily)
MGVDLERAIAELPESAREVFVLHEIHGYTHQEVGDLLGIEVGTSKSQLHHAREALREFLGDEHEEGN